MANSDTVDDGRPELERQLTRLRESEHRVKNTLQLISSIVLLQGRRTADESTRQALKAVLQRIAAISVAHRHVTWTEAGETIELSALIREITGDLAHSAGREDLSIDLDLESLSIPGRQAAPVALAVSEAVGNALRHAFPDGRTGRIKVGLRRAPANFELSVSDDGVGTSDPQSVGFGQMVIQLMVQQLRGHLTVDTAQPGRRISVTVPMETSTARA